MKSLLVALVVLFTHFSYAETKAENKMTGKKLQTIIETLGDRVTTEGNVIQFNYNGSRLICIYDSNANRMRVISPIATLDEVNQEQLAFAMAANFHTALDARYAVSEGVLYSAFIHPFFSLTEEEFKSAISQVANTNKTFGSTYSSGGMYFPGSQQQKLKSNSSKQLVI